MGKSLTVSRSSPAIVRAWQHREWMGMSSHSGLRPRSRSISMSIAVSGLTTKRLWLAGWTRLSAYARPWLYSTLSTLLDQSTTLWLVLQRRCFYSSQFATPSAPPSSSLTTPENKRKRGRLSNERMRDQTVRTFGAANFSTPGSRPAGRFGGAKNWVLLQSSAISKSRARRRRRLYRSTSTLLSYQQNMTWLSEKLEIQLLKWQKALILSEYSKSAERSE